MRAYAVIAVTIFLNGCFWESSPPDFSNGDQAQKLVVIWDNMLASDTVQRSTWSTTDSTQLQALSDLLDTESWQSSTVLPTGHSTRIILTMNSGAVWEICQGTGEKQVLNIFNRNDRGWSGWINPADEFIAMLAAMIAADRGHAVDLTSEYRMKIKEGSVKKIISADAQPQLTLYPGYPEMIWNAGTQEFEYAK